VRVFRADRVENATLLHEPARPPAGIELRDVNEGVYQPAAEHLLATLRVAAPYAWVADYYPTEDAVEKDGELVISLRVADPAWVRALVLGSGGNVTVLSPDWLAESIRAEAETALAAYGAG
jgi:proteasome accessory factor C